MPNHVKNNIIIECAPERLSEILEAVKYEKSEECGAAGPGTLDFNRIVPMPESLNIVSGSDTDRGIELFLTSKNPKAAHFGDAKMEEGEFEEMCRTLWRRSSFRGLKTEMSEKEIKTAAGRGDMEELMKLGETAVTNTLRYGAATWYDWRWDNWNTKWNSYGYDGGSPGGAGTPQGMSFETAWSPPHPVILQLSRMFPDVYIIHGWADEDLGCNCGRREYADGECVLRFEPDPGTKRAFEISFSQWGYTPEEAGYALSADGNEYIWDGQELEAVEICGQKGLFSEQRLFPGCIPLGTYCCDLRRGKGSRDIISAEPHAGAGFAGSVITLEPLDFGKDRRIGFAKGEGPVFLDSKETFREFIGPDLGQEEGMRM